MEPWTSTVLPTPTQLPDYDALGWDMQLLVACAALGLPANAFTLWLTGRRLRCRGLATFIFSLAASDFLFLGNSLLQIWSVANEHRWLLDTHWCRLHQFLYALGYYSSLFLLAAISLDRCLLVAVPFWYRSRRPARLPAALCAGAWLVAGGCSAPEAVLSVTEEELPGLSVCRSERKGWEVLLRGLEVLLEGLLPFAVVVLSHGAALLLVRCRRGPRGRPTTRFQCIVGATLSAYVGLQLPFQAVQLAVLLAPGAAEHLLYPLGLAFNLSSCVNPCLYLLLGTRACHHAARALRALGTAVVHRVYPAATAAPNTGTRMAPTATASTTSTCMTSTATASTAGTRMAPTATASTAGTRMAPTATASTTSTCMTSTATASTAGTRMAPTATASTAGTRMAPTATASTTTEAPTATASITGAAASPAGTPVTLATVTTTVSITTTASPTATTVLLAAVTTAAPASGTATSPTVPLTATTIPPITAVPPTSITPVPLAFTPVSPSTVTPVPPTTIAAVLPTVIPVPPTTVTPVPAATAISVPPITPVSPITTPMPPPSPPHQ